VPPVEPEQVRSRCLIDYVVTLAVALNGVLLLRVFQRVPDQLRLPVVEKVQCPHVRLQLPNLRRLLVNVVVQRLMAGKGLQITSIP
jgi:hypothetical protein